MLSVTIWDILASGCDALISTRRALVPLYRPATMLVGDMLYLRRFMVSSSKITPSASPKMSSASSTGPPATVNRNANAMPVRVFKALVFSVASSGQYPSTCSVRPISSHCFSAPNAPMTRLANQKMLMKPKHKRA